MRQDDNTYPEDRDPRDDHDPDEGEWKAPDAEEGWEYAPEPEEDLGCVNF